MNEEHGRMCKCDDCQQILADEWLADEAARQHEAMVSSGEFETSPDADLF